MKLSQLIESLQILQKYHDNDGYHFGSDHDIVYAYPTDKPLSVEDVQRMRTLGWFQDSEEYSQEESWQAYI